MTLDRRVWTSQIESLVGAELRLTSSAVQGMVNAGDDTRLPTKCKCRSHFVQQVNDTRRWFA